MQDIAPELKTAINANSQSTRPRVILDWANSRDVDHYKFFSTADYYSRVTILKHKPVLYWQFSDANASPYVSDFSGGGHHGLSSTGSGVSVFGDPITYPATSLVENDNSSIEFLFDASPGNITADVGTGIARTDNFCIEFWFKPTELAPSGNKIIYQIASPSLLHSQVYVNFSTGKLTGQVNVGATIFPVNSISNIVEDTRYYVVLRMVDGVLSMDINGVFQDSVTVVGTVNTGSSGYVLKVGGTPSLPYYGFVDEFAIYDYVAIPNTLASHARFLSGLNAGMGGAKNLHNITQVFDGKTHASFPWAILGTKDIDNKPVSSSGKYYATPKVGREELDRDYVTPLEDDSYDFGWISRNKTAVDKTFSLANEIYIHFDDRPVTHIGIYSSPFYGTVESFQVKYVTSAATIVTLGTFVLDPDTYSGEYPLNAELPVDCRGVWIKIITTKWPSAYAFIHEIDIVYREDVSADVISIDLQKVKESNDSTVPIGSTAANSATVVLQNIENQKYNLNHPTNPQAPYIGEDVKMSIALGWDTNNDDIVDQYIPQGTYWSDEFDAETSGMTATITARDKSKYLQDGQIPDSGMILEKNMAGEAVGDLARLGGIYDKDIDITETWLTTVQKDQPIGAWKISEKGWTDTAAGFTGTDLDYGMIWHAERKQGFVGHSVNLTSMTIEFWFKNAWPTLQTQTVLHYLSPFADTRIFFGSSGGINFQQADSADTINVATAVGDDEWHHYACTWSATAGQVIIYQDGQILVDSAAGTIYGGAIPYQGILYVAGRLALDPYTNVFAPVAPSENLNGFLSELRIWDNVRTQDNIRTYMGTRAYGDEDHLVGCWSFDEKKGTQAYNSVDASNTIYLSDGASNRISVSLFGVKDYGSIHDGYWKGHALTDYTSSPVVNEVGDKEFGGLFDGVNDQIVIPSHPVHDTTTDTTWEFWINPQAIDGNIAIKGLATGSWNITFVGGKVNLTRVGGFTISSPVLPLNTWTHVTIVFSLTDSRQEFYFNGVLQVKTGSDITNPWIANLNPIVLGSGFDGSLFGFCMYAYPLTAAQIMKHYLAGANSNNRRFKVFYSESESIWDSMLEIATPDLGMFGVDELDVFTYDTLDQYYNTRFTEHASFVYNLTDTAVGPTPNTNPNIIDADSKFSLLANKITAHIAPKNSKNLTKYSALWDGTDGESLQNTTLTANSYAGGVGSFTVAVRNDLIFPSPGFLKIGSEIIGYETWSPNGTIATLTRGLYGTLPAFHSNGTSVKEVRVYDIKFGGPAISVQYPFLTGDLFDKRVKIEYFKYTGFGATLVVSNLATDNETTVLQGENPLTGLQNFMSIAGINVEGDNTSAQGSQDTQVSDQIETLRRKWSKKELVIDNKYIDNKALAKKIVNFVLSRYRTPVPIISVTVIGIPHLQLGDRVRIHSLAQLNITDTGFFVMQSNMSYDGGLKQELILRQVV